ncbi:MAG: adenosylcobalamin-dependent ribonucleoside-diphosphate reductase, partial [Firmicutes bacterium]|nr:adenosylcobalamin-dependent ribonucleoside-diphosphate reductase [Bacillota bacterium]
MKLTDNGQKVFDARYASRDEKGDVIETFTEAVRRLADTAADIEQENRQHWKEKFVDAIGSLKFIPSTPIWANMGKNDRAWQPGACFVLDVEDSLESMYQTLRDTAMVFKSGGGVGYNFSNIRPQGSLVNSTKGKASGVVELIKLYDASSNMVMQGGVRRGASMGILNIDHPEIINFINAKSEGGLTNFNLSVGVTNRFMAALEADADWELVFNGLVYETVKAAALWEQITMAAHICGDPGIIFIDRLQEHNPVPAKVFNCTNPCGEQPLSPGESCLLGSINLARMMTRQGKLNRNLFRDTVHTAVRFLDNLIDAAQYPLQIIETSTKATRKIGLGFTGLHDALIKAGLAYDTAEGREFAGEITQFMQQSAHEASQSLADEKGCFPDWENSIFYPQEKRRNAACITIAPTGSVTAMAGCEGYGIEPIFAVAYVKKTNVAGDFEVFSPLFLEACQKYGVPQEVLSEVAKYGTCQNIPGIPEHIAGIFKGAQDINYEDHILMQAEVQKYVDNAVSKTINLPFTATPDTIDHCYRLAYTLNLKGITVFRDGCKEGTITVGQKDKQRAPGELRRGEILPRPTSAHGITHRLDTGCGKIYLTVNYQEDSGEILETF